MAQILKVAAMHRVTDTYGPIPYLNFGVSKEVPYDSQKDVYYRFFEELDGAINNLDSYAASGSKVLSSWDCVFNGDVTSWIKFANHFVCVLHCILPMWMKQRQKVKPNWLLAIVMD